MLNYSLPCSCSSFWLILKQQWTIENMSIFSNTYIPFLSRLAFRPCEQLPSLFVRPSTFHILIFSSETTIPARFGLIWFSGFREEDLNVICYQNMPNLHNRYKSDERKISQKNPEYILNYSLPCRIMSDSPALHSRWLLLLKIDMFSIVHCCFSISQNELKF
jgi:hypothetical protein